MSCVCTFFDYIGIEIAGPFAPTLVDYNNIRCLGQLRMSMSNGKCNVKSKHIVPVLKRCKF